MGNTPYILIVAAVLIFGAIMPQKGPQKKYYIILMAALHACLCGFRYQLLTGDLHKYYWTFHNSGTYGWFSEELLAGGRNSGFFVFNKLVNLLSGGDFQFFLFLIAVIIHATLAYVVYRYSPAPWMSFLAWNCMSFYIFGFSSIKQALAMALLMLAFVGIAEKKPLFFVCMVALAGTIHVPALIFLPAYWLAQRRVNGKMVAFYLVVGVLLYVFKNQFVDFIRSFYYEEDEIFVFSGEIGSRFIMILGFTLFGILLRGFANPHMEKLFHLMAIATMLQMLSGFDNIFTRLTDYYFQFAVLYIPMVFYSGKEALQTNRLRPVFPFNQRSMQFFAVVISAFMLWFYWTYNINITIAYEVDNYLNFRFMWDVKS